MKTFVISIAMMAAFILSFFGMAAGSSEETEDLPRRKNPITIMGLLCEFAAIVTAFFCGYFSQ